MAVCHKTQMRDQHLVNVETGIPPSLSYDSLYARSESKAYRTFRIRNVANGRRPTVHKNGRHMETGLRTAYTLYIRLVMQVTSRYGKT